MTIIGVFSRDDNESRYLFVTLSQESVELGVSIGTERNPPPDGTTDGRIRMER
jgi:hypothetical protein